MKTVDFENLFSLGAGSEAYAMIENTVSRLGMAERIDRGVLVGFSGGADSMLLLCFVLEYRRRRKKDFHIVACHVNHGIRGDEALRDEAFSRGVADLCGVEFICASVDVPSLASEQGLGLEEMARNVRYAKFAETISGRNDIGTVAVAHNATDNMETVIFNLLRGAGTKGLSGIAPVRDNIIRPLIELPKASILEALDSAGIEYVFDSTNDSLDYTRNYIRGVVTPTLTRLAPIPEVSITRASQNIRQDSDFIDGLASDFIGDRARFESKELRSLHPALFARVIALLSAGYGSSVERAHIDAIRRLLPTENFSYDLPHGVRFLCEQGTCRLVRADAEECDFSIAVNRGVNAFSKFDSELTLFSAKDEEISSNIYKISIQARLTSAIIDGELYIRSRMDGDTVFYGGHHHKLKKIMCDLKVPKSVRAQIPVLCDARGVLWVPGLPPRDDGVRDGDLTVRLGIGLGEKLSDRRFYSLTEFRS